ncbi:MAG: S-layer homology domain-containing protein [Andreesenia angusta]|nr:S-layer homology domain-containing protein [Andreesenia angusta]
MINKTVLSLATILILNTFSISSAEPITSDTHQGNWYDDSVIYFKNNKSLNLDDYFNKFEPNKNIERKEIIALFKKVSDSIVNTEGYIFPEAPFKDIPDDENIKKSIDWAYDNLITNGINDNEFAPDNNLTREEAITFIYRLSKIFNLNLNDISKTIEFDDYDDSSSFAKKPIKWAIDKEIIKGYDNKIYPKNNITQAEILQMTYNLFNKMNENKENNFSLSFERDDIQDIVLINSNFKKIKADKENLEEFLKEFEELKFSSVESRENTKANTLIAEFIFKESSNKLSYSFFESHINCGSYKYKISDESSKKLKSLIKKWDSLEGEDFEENQGKLNK